MSWQVLLIKENPPTWDAAEFLTGKDKSNLYCTKHKYGPIDVWYDCHDCLQEFNRKFPDEDNYRENKRIFLNDNRHRWKWIRETEWKEKMQ